MVLTSSHAWYMIRHRARNQLLLFQMASESAREVSTEDKSDPQGVAAASAGVPNTFNKTPNSTQEQPLTSMTSSPSDVIGNYPNHDVSIPQQHQNHDSRNLTSLQ